MPVRDRTARDRFMRQASFSGTAAMGFGGGPVFHHPARRTSVQDAAALRNRRRSTLRRQVARELIAEEEEDVPGEPKASAAASAAWKSFTRQVVSSPPDASASTSRLRSRRQSTPVISTVRFDREFITSTSGQQGRPPFTRRSISTDEGSSPVSALASR